MRYFVLIILLSNVMSNLALKILMFQTAVSNDYLTFSSELSAILKKRNHTVDKVVHFYDPRLKVPNMSSIRNLYKIFLNSTNPAFAIDKYGYGNDDLTAIFCNETIKNSKLMKQLNAENYDIMLSTPHIGCPFAIARKLGIRATIGILTAIDEQEILQLLGIPQPPAVYGASTFLDRARNVRRILQEYFADNKFLKEQQVIDSIYPNLPRIRYLIRRMAYLMIDKNEILDYITPVSSKVKFIADLSKRPVSDLDEEYNQLLDVPNNGVVVMPKINGMSQIYRRIFLELFCKWPDYTFICDSDDIQKDLRYIGNSSNVVIRRNIPYHSLIRDPRIKVVISEMEQTSYHELAEAGKVIIAVPLSRQNLKNAKAGSRLGFVHLLDIQNISNYAVENALRFTLEDNKYSETATKVAQMLAENPGHIGADEFVRYVGHAARFASFRTDVLQMASADLDIPQLYGADVALAFIAYYAVIGFIGTATFIFCISPLLSTVIDNELGGCVKCNSIRSH